MVPPHRVRGRAAPTGLHQEILSFFPPSLRGVLARLPVEVRDGLQEIRVRAGQPLLVRLSGRDAWVGEDGSLSDHPGQGYRIGPQETQRLLQAISRASVYALEEELRQGFLTLPGGHRVGLAGEVAAAQGAVRTLKHISAFTFRLAREIPGAADPLLDKLVHPGTARLCHTLILSPPGCGKTTLLRDLARQISNGRPPRHPGRQVAIVDERSELAGCWQGVPQRDVGACTDVLDRCPRAAGVLMLLRAMAPQVIVTDEIGRPEDVQALQEARHAGVTIVASAHGASWAEVQGRPTLRPLTEAGAFERVVVLSGRRGPGTLEAVLRTGPARNAGQPA